MSYLHVKLKTPKTIPSWAVRTLLGQIRERPPSPPPNPRWELPLPVWMWLAFCQGLCMVLIQANSYPTLSMPRWELLLPVGMLLTSCANSPLHLSPPPPPAAGESYPSCIGASSPTPSPLGELALSVSMLLTCYVFSQGLRTVLIQANWRSGWQPLEPWEKVRDIMLGHRATLNRKSKMVVVWFCFRRSVIDTSGKVFFKFYIDWESIKKVSFTACPMGNLFLAGSSPREVF